MAGIPARIQKKPYKGGAFLGGVGGSGNVKRESAAEKAAKAPVRGGKGAFRVEAGKTGPTSAGTPKDQWVGSGEKKRYVQVPEANKDRGRVSVPKSAVQQDQEASAKAGGNVMGGSRQVTRRGGEDKSKGARESGAAAERLAAQVAQGPGGEKKAPPAPGSLNYFMRKAGGRKNAAYQMYKKHKQAQRRGDTK